jgi:hypothetical protein
MLIIPCMVRRQVVTPYIHPDGGNRLESRGYRLLIYITIFGEDE